ncbi:MAG: glycosyltransferase family 4 protein [Candidatus Njordarchaeales archaeon]
MNFPIFASNKENKEIIIVVYPLPHSEVLNPKFGGARLIFEQIKFFKDNGYKVRLMSLENIGSLISLLCRLRRKFSRHNKKLNISENKRWWLNLFSVIAIDFLSGVDVLFRVKLKHQLNDMTPSILIYHYPYGIRSFISILKNLPVKVVIYEHNIEWKLFEDNIGRNIIAKSFIWLVKNIELSNLEKADYIFCVTERDKEVLVKEGKIDPAKVKVWVPLCQKKVDINLNNISNSLKEKLNGKFIIGFVGTNFKPNITAVKNIIKIANKAPKDVIFLIIGSVNEAFVNRKDIPSNVIFTGYVDDLDAYLGLCDAFINPKTTSDTGIEIKMFDYLKFNKSIISTEIGARGFENFKKVIIVPIEKMVEIINKLYKCDNYDIK